MSLQEGKGVRNQATQRTVKFHFKLRSTPATATTTTPLPRSAPYDTCSFKAFDRLCSVKSLKK
jgi:hypothetical protein